MPGVLERRRGILKLMRSYTLDRGFFTVSDIAASTGLPRSTAQDWINRLLDEGCLVVREGRRGRAPARYLSKSAMPSSACRRIFTTIDGDEVEIYHECLSAGSAAYCEFHHRRAGGVLSRVSRDGTLLRERAFLGERGTHIGFFPDPAVGVTRLRQEGEDLVQAIRCVGGPAYSLTDMMAQAEGVLDVRVERSGPFVEGEVTTRAMRYLAIGIDDTDTPEGGATFALALALHQHLSTLGGVMPIGHHVVMLNPENPDRTGGNSASFIELAAEPALCPQIREHSLRFVSDEALSPEWGIAIKGGFTVPRDLREFGNRARTGRVTREEAGEMARRHGIFMSGGRGTIGALAAVSCIGLDNSILLDPKRAILPEGGA
ncbi:MAG TPA: sugar-specific transcriptional regulator TrmB [Methanomicrobiales archaeon]|nr:sugar-specific transcriptional regulator TrmB [Methanomicrobiales archaeon]